MEKNDEKKYVEVIFEPEASVLADGEEITRREHAEALITSAYIVCCDGAARKLKGMGREPDAIVGDGDSLPEALKEEYASIFHVSADQETNDQTKAVNYLHEKGKRRVLIFGATGKREDHTLGNISLLMDYMRKGMEVRMVTNYGVFVPCRGTSRFRSYSGQQVSIFNFGSTEMRSEGLEYPLYDFTTWWQGTLNRALGDRFTIEANGDYLVFVVM